MAPTPPYTAVIFTAQRTDVENEAYETAAWRMVELACQQPGYLGIESARDQTGLGITVSYWESAEAAKAWKNVGEHLLVQEAGRDRWYSSYTIRIATVEREYGFRAVSDSA
jgi:heme-degrading monooxygenase HmoA